MQRRINLFLLLFMIIALVMTSAVRTTPVYADDGDTEPVTEGSAAPPAGEESSTEAESAPAVEAAPPAVEEPLPASESEEPAPAATEPPAAETEATEDAPTVAEVLEQLPEETALVVVNDEGEVEPLATVEAADIIAVGDPVWCPASLGAPTPGANGCTQSRTSFAALLADLADPAYNTAGIIWVAFDYQITEDNSQIALEGNDPASGYLGNLPNLSSSNLTIRGGWHPSDNSVDPTTPSNLDVSLSVAFWSGNISLENLVIRNTTDDAGFGLWVDTTGNVTLENVLVSDTPLLGGMSGNGAMVNAGGDVSISNSEFNNNAGNGLLVYSNGNIELDTVSANNNRLTGAYLDSCLYGTVDPDVCAGTGAVTIIGSSTTPYSNQFDHNGYNPDGSGNPANGLIVNAGGAIAIDHVQANNNSVNGASLNNTDIDNTANVTVNTSEFAYNRNGAGVYVFSGGNVGLNAVYADANGTGAELYTTSTTGAINISNSVFGETNLTLGNRWTGLHVESLGTISLNNVLASYNGANGAYLIAEGNIVVNGGQFNGNVQSSSTDDPGLRAISWGDDIRLTNVTANNNQLGAGVGLDTFDTGTITITGGVFNQNGTFGVQAGSNDGNITLDGVIASYNQVKGAYLGAFWAGNIRIDNSTFVENGAFGISAFTNEGNIELNLVTVLGSDGAPGPGADNFTDYGALLEAGGNVNLNNSTFNLNTDVGLIAISGSQVALANVVADQNGVNGVEVYSLTTAGPICEGEAAGIIVRVGGGAYTNNGGYGLLVRPGPQSTLEFGAPTTFGGNGLGDYLIDLSQDYKDCTPGPKEEKPYGKGPLVVDVPPTGGPTVEQDCDTYTGTILKLPDGTWVQISCPFEGFSHLEEVLEENLPTRVGAGMDFVTSIDLDLTDIQGNTLLNEDGTITINFAIPEDAHAGHYAILFWDPAANNGAGGWVNLPPYEVGTSFALHPDNPEDGRTIFSGVKRIGNLVTVTVDFSGVFVLVAQ